MNNILKKTFFGVAIALTCAATTSNAQIYVKVHPHFDAVVRTAPPSPRHVWVDEDWRVRHGRYEYAGGYWAAPPRPAAVWIPGHWRETPRGSVWVGGHWR